MADRIGYNGADKWKLKATELLNEGGGGGTDDYEDLENKPSINGVELSGNKTAAQLGMYTKSEVDTSLANKMDLNATNGSISNLNILGNYGIGNVENGGCVYITGSQNKYLDNTFFPEIAIASYDSVNDEYHQIVSMSRFGLLVTTGFSYNCYKGEGAVRGIDVSIEDHLLCIKEGVSDTNIIKVDNTRNIDVNADRVDFNSDYMVFAYAEDGFSFSSDDDFEIDAVGIKIASDGITKSRALYVDANGYLVSSAVTDTELGYLSGVTSGIQSQLDAKQASITGGATTIVSSNLTASRALVSDSSGKVAVSAVTSTELGYLDGVTSAIQTQLDGKVAKSGDTMSGVLNSTYKSDTLVNSLTSSAISLSDTANSFGGWICGPTKNGRIAISTYQGNDDMIYFGYGERGRTKNSYVRQMTWDGGSGLLTTGALKLSGGRVASAGDDEGLVITPASNNYAAVCLGNPSGRRSVFYLKNSGGPWWRYNDGTASYDIIHPAKSGTILLSEDTDTAASGSTVAKRQKNGCLYATYFNTTAGSENPASYTAYPAFIDSNGWLRKTSIANMKAALGINSKVNNGWTELLAFGSYTSGSKTLSAKITDYAGGIMVARCGASGSSGGSVCGFWPISTGIYSYTSDYFEVSWIEGTNTMKRLTFHFTAANKITIDASINSAALRAIYVLA